MSDVFWRPRVQYDRTLIVKSMGETAGCSRGVGKAKEHAGINKDAGKQPH